MELLAALILNTVSGARDILGTLVTDGLNLTTQGQSYVNEIASLLSALANSSAQALADLLS
jgi:hypothetical protein